MNRFPPSETFVDWTIVSFKPASTIPIYFDCISRCGGLSRCHDTPPAYDGMIYTTGLIDKEGILFAFDSKGDLKWKVTYGPEWTGSHPGVHSTPTVDGDRLYLMSGMGRIACHNARTGEHIWHIDTLRKFGGKNIRWGIAESVLIEGDKVICTPGGPGASVVALNKMSGETIWTSKDLGEPSGYCSPVAVDAGSKRIVLTLLEKSVVGIDINDGKVGLIKINPDGYEMISSFQITKGTAEHWAHPAISDRRLYIRHGDALMCYDIRQ